MLEGRRGLVKCTSTRLSSERTDYGRLWILGCLTWITHRAFLACPTRLSLQGMCLYRMYSYLCASFRSPGPRTCSLSPESLWSYVWASWSLMHFSLPALFASVLCAVDCAQAPMRPSWDSLDLASESSSVTVHNNTDMASWWLVRWKHGWGCGGLPNVGTYKKVLVCGALFVPPKIDRYLRLQMWLLAPGILRPGFALLTRFYHNIFVRWQQGKSTWLT
ncbi:hypothetical protein EDC04DRAFT_1813391 [Pisolithus marmoratus]|nr:hypothetical protein EDC04DRAFT_1813391 [Pisolithus marmoratus]